MPTKAPPALAGPTTCSSIEDFFTTACQLSWFGVRFYGTVDVGGGYQTNGSRFAKFTGAGINYFLGKANNGGKWAFSPNSVDGANIGVQMKEPPGARGAFLCQVEAGVNPHPLELADGVHTVYEQRGHTLCLGDVGADFKVGPGVFSTDVIAGYTKDAVAMAVAGTPTDKFGPPVNIFTPGFGNAFLSATLSDNAVVMVNAKYTMERVKLYAGWEWVQQKNPSDPFTVPGSGFLDVAGDFVCFGCTNLNGTNISSTAFNGGTKILQIAWFGGTYALLPNLDLTAAYYHEWQNDFSGGAKNGARGTCAVATTALSSCVGTPDAVSIMLDLN